MMRTTALAGAAAVAALTFVGCSKDDNLCGPGSENGYIGSLMTKFRFSIYATFHVESVVKCCQSDSISPNLLMIFIKTKTIIS